MAEGEVRFYAADGKVARLPVAAVESVERGRWHGLPSVAVVTPKEIIHIRDLFAPEERAWVSEALAAAIISAQERRALVEA